MVLSGVFFVFLFFFCREIRFSHSVPKAIKTVFLTLELHTYDLAESLLNELALCCERKKKPGLLSENQVMLGIFDPYVAPARSVENIEGYFLHSPLVNM